MRRSVRGFFDRLAEVRDERVRPDAPEHLAALAAAVARLEAPPAQALDIGTGTGAGALWLARAFPDAFPMSETTMPCIRSSMSLITSSRLASSSGGSISSTSLSSALIEATMHALG
jgi:hypothetical protein